MPPVQIDADDEVAVIVGSGFTTIVFVIVLTQPAEDVPTIVYVVVTVGETVTELPVKFPGIQAYVVAPLTVIVVLAPEQIVEAVAVVERLGGGITETVIAAVPEQPKEFIPVTK